MAREDCLQVVRVVRHTLKDGNNLVSPVGRKLAGKMAPFVLSGFPPCHPVYVSPQLRCRQTAEALGLPQLAGWEIREEKHFDAITARESAPFLEQAKAIVNEQGCDIVSALMAVPGTAAMFARAGRQYRRGVLKVARMNRRHGHILVVGHSWSIEPAAGLTKEIANLDFVDFFVKGNRIVMTVHGQFIR